MISASFAWEILDRYVQDCLKIDRDSLLAVYATGSLGGGYYRPGQSDIDAVLIVADGSQEIWGDWEEGSEQLAALNRAYRERYQIPKDFGPFAIQENELYPPYDPTLDLLPLEIARLKVQGLCVYGAFDLASVPMPAAEDFRQGARNFEAWWRQEFAKDHPLSTLSGAACVNSVLLYLGRYLRIECGVLEFNKRALVAAYLAHDPPFVDRAAFRLVETSLAEDRLSEPQVEHLQRCVAELRAQMNALLEIGE